MGNKQNELKKRKAVTTVPNKEPSHTQEINEDIDAIKKVVSSDLQRNRIVIDFTHSI